MAISAAGTWSVNRDAKCNRPAANSRGPQRGNRSGGYHASARLPRLLARTDTEPDIRVGDGWQEGTAEVPRDALSRTSSSKDRKSTRLNSSHHSISYAVFCLKK